MILGGLQLHFISFQQIPKKSKDSTLGGIIRMHTSAQPERAVWTLSESHAEGAATAQVLEHLRSAQNTFPQKGQKLTGEEWGAGGDLQGLDPN